MWRQSWLGPCVLAFSLLGCGPDWSGLDITLGMDAPCGHFAGITLDVPPESALSVGERLRVTGNLGAARYVSLRTQDCPSSAVRLPYFPRVAWRYSSETIRVELVSCPCSVTYERDVGQGKCIVGAEVRGAGPIEFDVIGLRPGPASLRLAGYLSGPCGGGSPEDPVVECGSSAEAYGFFDVVEADR